MTKIVKLTVERDGQLIEFRVGDIFIDEADGRVEITRFAGGPDLRMVGGHYHCWPLEGLTPLPPLEQLAKTAE